MELIIPDWDAPANVGAFATTRRGGFSVPPYDDGQGGGGLNLGAHVGDRPEDVRRNRDLLGRLLPAEPAWLSQVHGKDVVDAAGVAGTPPADASIAAARGVVCVVQTADCLPVLFCAANGKVVGAAHAGWRGLAGGVLENTVAAMRAAGADEILAWLGPAIGLENFEVGEDVLSTFVSQDAASATAFKLLPGKPGKYLADIYRLARQRLIHVGVVRCHGGGSCTVADRSRFYSYRRDRETGRMASLIWIK
ncbi:MAG TPA: peptidoglycan editing factor PgeF [Paucimonas sp.]|nr:peptidoglycan editing factor PgeF [Paucimonas sp.]